MYNPLPFLALTFSLMSSSVMAFNYVNIDDENQGAVRANPATVGRQLGIAENPSQITLIHPRVAVTATHGSLQGLTTPGRRQVPPGEWVLRFGDRNYNVTHMYEPVGAGVQNDDFTLVFLDHPVVGVAPTPLVNFTGEVRDFFVHALSYNRRVMLNDERWSRDRNREGGLQYGRAFVSFMQPPIFDHPAFKVLRVVRPAESIENRDVVVPIGGDSGSPAFVEVQNDEEDDGRSFGLIGPVSGVNAGHLAEYTYLYPYKRQIEAAIQEVLGLVDPVELETVGSDIIVKNPLPLAHELLDLAPTAALPLEFDPDAYLRLNSDVGGEGDLEVRRQRARDHYMDYGHAEGRVWYEEVVVPSAAPAQQPVAVPSSLPPHFNPELYARLYPDLAGNSDEWLRGHYVNHGIGEGRRILPEGFDPDYYINAYDDLRSSTEGMTLEDKRQWARTHYANHGASENRMFQIPTHFNSDVYLQLHVDLLGAVAGISDLVAREDWARTHYKNHGVVEGRATLPNGLEEAEALWEHMLLLDDGAFFEQLGDTLTNEQKLQRTRERVVQDWIGRRESF